MLRAERRKPYTVTVVQQTSDLAGEESWGWLRNGFLKKGTVGVILAAQE